MWGPRKVDPGAQALLWGWVIALDALQACCRCLLRAEEMQIIQGHVIPLQAPCRILLCLDTTHRPGAPGAPATPLAPGRPWPFQDVPIRAGKAGTGGGHFIAQEPCVGCGGWTRSMKPTRCPQWVHE